MINQLWVAVFAEIICLSVWCQIFEGHSSEEYVQFNPSLGG
jgi:hypothetical protein